MTVLRLRIFTTRLVGCVDLPPPLQDAQRPQRGRAGVGVSDVVCTWLFRLFHRHSGGVAVGWGLPHRDCASNSGACTDLPPPLWAGTHEKCGSIFHGNRRRAGVGLLAARTVFLQSHLYIHMKRSDVCKQGSEQTAGTPIITLPPPQPSPAALHCGGGGFTATVWAFVF